MKIAFTTSGDDIDAPLDTRFGRAVKFLVYNLDDSTFELIDNEQNLQAAQGAGIQAAENIARSGAKCLITGHCGPKAFKVLKAAGITVYNAEAETISQALEAFKSGTLTSAESADVEGHWT